MNRQDRRAAKKYLVEKQAAMTEEFRFPPRTEWADDGRTNRSRVAINRRFLVQEFKEQDGVIRLSVNRCAIGARGEWLDGITWDELQDIKNAMGYADRDAVEIYPPTRDVVCVANMRHLWVLPALLPFGWRKP